MSEFATSAEVNGLGTRVNDVKSNVAAHTEAIGTIKDTMKEDRRDLWNAVTGLRNKVDGLALKIGGMQAAALALQVALWYFTKK